MSEEAKLSWGHYMDGEILASWPKNQAGETEEPVFLCTRGSTDLSDQLTMNMLKAYGIPCLSMERGEGSLGKVVLGISGYGVDIYVPASLLEDARKLLDGPEESAEDPDSAE